jgi:SAM-dependent methyltransferase
MSHAEYLEPYRQALARFGPSFEATLWNSRDAQVLRFDVMIELAGFTDAVVLDVGCGHGDLAWHLLEREIPFHRYVGLDALDELIEAARKRNLERCVFECADAVADPAAMTRQEPDYVCLSGTLNTMEEPVARGLVQAAFEASRVGVVFNFLSTRVASRWKGQNLGPAHRFDPVRWVDFALGLSPRVTFTQAYLEGHDATILVQHPASG